jgi:biotin synthase
MIAVDLKKIYKKSLEEEFFSREECLGILNFPDENLSELLDVTLKIRELHKGRKVSIHVLTNAKSGNCGEDCKYCAQSCTSNTDIERYSILEYEKILNNGKICKEKGVERHCIGLSGMNFTDEQIDKFCEYVKRMRGEVSTKICCSIGFLTEKQAKKLKKVGVTRINHNLNTGKNFYKNICSTHTYEQRITNINMLKEVGFEMCCGGIVGLGEGDEDLIDMFFDIKRIGPESIPINFLIPIKGTPLEKNNNVSKLTPEYCLKVLSLGRLLNPKADLRCAAGREIYLKNKQSLMFCAVNSVFASGYLTAAGQGINETIKMIQEAGFNYTKE